MFSDDYELVISVNSGTALNFKPEKLFFFLAYVPDKHVLVKCSA